jgi:PAS domain S-box-containing protein
MPGIKRNKRINKNDKPESNPNPSNESKTPKLEAEHALSNETLAAVDAAITSVVQAIGSKAGILTFWDENRQAPGHFSTYGLNTGTLDQLRPIIGDLVQELSVRTGEIEDEGTQKTITGLGAAHDYRAHSDTFHDRSYDYDNEQDLAAVQTDIPTRQGFFHVIALPIYTEGRFIAALCLIQSPIIPAALVEHHPDSPALPPADVQIPSEWSESNPMPPPDFDTSEALLPATAFDPATMVARNARLLSRLVEEKQWLQAIISYSADGILIVDKNCDIVGFNPAFARLSGWTVDELRGQNCYDTLRFTTTKGEEHCRILCPLRLGLLSSEKDEAYRVEAVMLTKDKQKCFVELNYSVILSPTRDILGGIIGVRDITARKEAEELQNTFLSVISHELQTPIAVIKGYAGLLADETTDMKPEQLREKMQIIYEESDRLSKMVEDLLYASRVQAGGLKLELEPLHLTRLLERVVQKMKSTSKNHQLILKLPTSLPLVVADYDKIQEVVVNLIENAIKYSPKGGPITLEAQSSNTEVVVSVTDEGIGIPEGEREHIFERFSRLDSRYVRQRKGAGLGLYICKAIIEAHGGIIWVDAAPSETGKEPSGSRFSFSLPRESPSQLPVLFGKL